MDSIRIAGVDGCPLGWLVASGTLMGNRIANVDVKAFPTFREVLTFAGHNAIVSVDMPIGLLDEPRPGGRDCEKAARKMLSGTRKSSVFSAPPRSALRAKRFEDVSGMTIQSFHLVKRIRDVDRALTPEKQRLVVESHPELVFALLSDGTLPPKREPAGFQHRMDILRQCVPRFTEDASALAETVGSAYLRKQVRRDDIPDALVMLWLSAKRAKGQARRFEETPPIDSEGLRMEMWIPKL